MAENFLRRELVGQGQIDSKGKATQVARQSKRQYYGDVEIEQMLDLEKGTINKLTGTYLIAFDTPDEDQRQVVDIGLNIKNYTKKVHIADYVRFIASGGAANTILDDFNHNRHARGASHVRKHWEYSGECVQIVTEYLERFPEAIEAIEASSQLRKDKAMHSLQDLYPEIPRKEKNKAIAKLKEMLSWLENLALSKLPYVEMGFDALDIELVTKLQAHSEHVQTYYKPVDLKVQPTETIAIANVYEECFPYWFGPFYEKPVVNDFRVGNRVLHLNSTLRRFIPFGARGTVVGKTEAKLIVMFDEQFLHGHSIYGHCQAYGGAQVAPEHLLNLSREFARLVKENYKAANKFMEKPLPGFPAFADELTPEQKANEAPQSSLSGLRATVQPKKTAAAGAGSGDGNLEPKEKPKERPRRQPEGPVAAQAGLDTAARSFVPKIKKFQPKEERKKEERKSQQPSLTYQPKAKQPGTEGSGTGAVATDGPVPSSEQPKPAEITLGAEKTEANPEAGALFGALPGLKPADPSLVKEPKW